MLSVAPKSFKIGVRKIDVIIIITAPIKRLLYTAVLAVLPAMSF